MSDNLKCECGGCLDIKATLIGCRSCGTVWGRVNGAWVEDPGEGGEEAQGIPEKATNPPIDSPRGVAGDRCEVGNECGRAGCPECQQ